MNGCKVNISKTNDAKVFVIFRLFVRRNTMQVRVFEPALCCNTGVCGPDMGADSDDSLVVFTADLAFAKSQHADVERHNLANDPMAFVNSAAAKTFLEVAGSEGLPLTTVDGVTVMTGTYPTREQLLKFAGLGAGDSAEVGATAATSASAPAARPLLTMVDVSADANADAAPGNVCGPSGCC